MSGSPYSLSTIVSTAFAAWVVYVLGQAIHRLYFSPVAKFPGPKLAAVSFWYEFYYDVYLSGQYTFKIARLHEEYGPIIRINPYELHIITPEFYEKLYVAGGKRRHRWGWMTSQFGLDQAMFGTVDHDKHRIRRAALNPFFSKAAVRNLQPIVDDRVAALLRRFQEYQASGEPIITNYAFSAYTNDIAQEYAFAKSDHRIEQADFEPTFHDAAVAGSASGVLIKQFPWLLPLMEALPQWFMTWLDPKMASFFALTNNTAQQIAEMKAGTRDDSKGANHKTIFYEILKSDLPPEEKSDKRLSQDGETVVIAGTLTTAWALCVALFYLLSQPETLRRLKQELETFFSSSKRPTVAELEQLPYLTGCIQECIRLSYGVSSRLQRIAPDETLIFHDKTSGKDWAIPPGTPVGMTSVLIHHDESIFPDSKKFLPERWIGHPHLDKYLVSFSKGSRICLGINLAYAELYLALAGIFAVYGSKDVREEGDVGYLELWETTEADVTIAKDVFIPLAADESKGVRILVKK
ncbi:hypothetical protein BP5796_11980 [Coleophoma crateriformis]|uniref:Uncharacterized protein n=1 Tax=Coleophoma crateriformis TaxID=565419 RepID=A0A3D8QB42_9HELO|nr:hypothetical protein BP5796_11980 [Coleophoma crateriformis]